MDKLILVSYFTGLMYYLLGWFFKRRPPRDRHGRKGHRSRRARSSQAAWDFAQRYSATAFQWVGLGIMALGFAARYLPAFAARPALFVGLFAILIVAPLIATELALKKRF